METDLIKTGFFKREERIKNPVSFKKLFKNGKKASISGAKIFYLENGTEMNRVGFPLPRGYGNAVQRNLSKRYSREVYRLLKTHLNTGYDILLLVYPGNDSFSTRCVQFRTLFKKAGLIKEWRIWNILFQSFSVWLSVFIKDLFRPCTLLVADSHRRALNMLWKQSKNMVLVKAPFWQ